MGLSYPANAARAAYLLTAAAAAAADALVPLVGGACGETVMWLLLALCITEISFNFCCIPLRKGAGRYG